MLSRDQLQGRLNAILAELAPGAEIAGIGRIPGGYRVKIRYRGKDSGARFLPFAAAEEAGTAGPELMRQTLVAALTDIDPTWHAASSGGG